MPEDEKATSAPAPQRTVVRERTIVETNDPPLGPNASTTAPDDHHFEVNGRKVNAWGEAIDSPEAKKRL